MITWQEARYTGFIGTADSIHLFSVNWRTQRNKPDWSLRTDLSGLRHEVWESDDREELYRRAEKILAAWLARVTGAPVPS